MKLCKEHIFYTLFLCLFFSLFDPFYPEKFQENEHISSLSIVRRFLYPKLWHFKVWWLVDLRFEYKSNRFEYSLNRFASALSRFTGGSVDLVGDPWIRPETSEAATQIWLCSRLLRAQTSWSHRAATFNAISWYLRHIISKAKHICFSIDTESTFGSLFKRWSVEYSPACCGPFTILRLWVY